MKIQTDAANVLQRASAQLKSGLLKEKPLWYDIIAKYPPTSTNDLIKNLMFMKVNLIQEIIQLFINIQIQIIKQ